MHPTAAMLEVTNGCARPWRRFEAEQTVATLRRISLELRDFLTERRAWRRSAAMWVS